MIWSDLQDKTNNIYSEMIRKLMSEVDEGALISKKKRIQNFRNQVENSAKMH